MTMATGIRRKLKRRKRTAHKGDFGRVFILAGSRGLTGAAYLSSIAALKTGAGLVTLGVPERIYPIVARRAAEVMVRPFPSTKDGSFAYRSLSAVLKFAKTQDVIALGPGLSQNQETQKWVRHFLVRSPLPVVVDADGLNALKGYCGLLKKFGRRAVLTPHPGEFARMFGRKASTSERERKKQASYAAKRFQTFVVLKGHHTIVADPRGKTYVNRTGNPGMATGGSGDVLTGIVAALLGQKMSLWDAACLGVTLHGLAGDLAAKKIGQVSLTATDIVDFLPAAVKKVSV